MVNSGFRPLLIRYDRTFYIAHVVGVLCKIHFNPTVLYDSSQPLHGLMGNAHERVYYDILIHTVSSGRLVHC